MPPRPNDILSIYLSSSSSSIRPRRLSQHSGVNVSYFDSSCDISAQHNYRVLHHHDPAVSASSRLQMAAGVRQCTLPRLAYPSIFPCIHPGYLIDSAKVVRTKQTQIHNRTRSQCHTNGRDGEIYYIRVTLCQSIGRVRSTTQIGA